MNRKLAAVAVLVACVLAHAASAVFEITAAIQRELDRRLEDVKAMAADPVIVKAVFWENQKGPIAGMDNEKWKSVRRSDEMIRSFVGSDAGKLLAHRLEASGGVYVRAYVCGSRGEKVASTEKTPRYLNAGQPYFDVPFTTAQTWQGPPEFDAVDETNDIHLAAPVLNGGRPIGVLVVGLDLGKLAKTAGK